MDKIEFLRGIGVTPSTCNIPGAARARVSAQNSHFAMAIYEYREEG